MCSPWRKCVFKYPYATWEEARYTLGEGNVLVSILLLKEVMADSLLLQHFLSPFFSLLSQGPAASSCLLHHLWPQSAQTSLVERGKGDEELKSTKIVTHRERKRQGGREERGQRGQEWTGQRKLTFEAF